MQGDNADNGLNPILHQVVNLECNQKFRSGLGGSRDWHGYRPTRPHNQEQVAQDDVTEMLLCLLERIQQKDTSIKADIPKFPKEASPR